ncbi:putative membrane protein (plasmid) [Bacillus cereus E33L]|nr:putative membrane protein [Bacillus cereus E33L]
MSLTLLTTTLLLILISNFIIKNLLKNKIKKTTLNFISSVVVLPGISLFWLITYTCDLPFNIFLSFYFPLIITIFLILMLIINLIKLIKNVDV